MALGMLLGGMALLGGGQYLLGKRSEQINSNTINRMRQEIENTDPALAQSSGMHEMLASAEQRAAQGGMLNPNHQQINGMFDQMLMNRTNRANAIAQSSLANQRWHAEQGAKYINDVQSDHDAIVGQYASVQRAGQNLIDRLDDPTGMSGFELNSALVDYLELILPGEVKTSADFEEAAGAAGLKAELFSTVQRALGGDDVTEEGFKESLREEVLRLGTSAEERYDNALGNITYRLENNPHSQYTRGRERDVTGNYGITDFRFGDQPEGRGTGGGFQQPKPTTIETVTPAGEVQEAPAVQMPMVVYRHLLRRSGGSLSAQAGPDGSVIVAEQELQALLEASSKEVRDWYWIQNQPIPD